MRVYIYLCGSKYNLIMNKKSLVINIVSNLVIVLVIGLLFVGSLNRVGVSLVNGKNDAIYRGNQAESNVTPMFNVYWGTEYIEGILEVLEKRNIKTTFFVGGSWVAKNPEMLKLIVEKGHEIGSHGYLHREADKLNYQENLDEIEMSCRIIEKYVNMRPTLFAPPSGAVGSAMFTACKDSNMTVIMWSKDTIDWRDKDKDLVLKRATSDIQNGELILMHPTEHTLKALPKILDFYIENGFNVVPVSHNIAPSKV